MHWVCSDKCTLFGLAICQCKHHKLVWHRSGKQAYTNTSIPLHCPGKHSYLALYSNYTKLFNGTKWAWTGQRWNWISKSYAPGMCTSRNTQKDEARAWSQSSWIVCMLIEWCECTRMDTTAVGKHWHGIAHSHGCDQARVVDWVLPCHNQERTLNIPCLGH